MPRRRRRRYRLRLKPAGYAFFGGVFLLIGLGLFFLIRTIVRGISKDELTTMQAPISSVEPFTPSPTYVPTPTATPAPTPSLDTPNPETPTDTPAKATVSPAKATATPSSSIRNATSEEKKNAKAGYLTGDGVNLRVGPSTDYMSLGKYSKNATLVVYATDGKFDFVRMDKDKKVGFVSKSYVKIGETTAATAIKEVPSGSIGGSVTASKVALRDAASKSGTAIAELHAGDQVFISYKTGDFYYLQVASSGKKGFAYASYISAAQAVPVQ